MMDKNLRMKVIMSALDKVTAPLKKIRTGSTTTAKALKDTSDRLKELNSQQRKIDGLRKQQEGFRGLTATLKKTKLALFDTRDNLEDQRIAHQELAGKVKASRVAFRVLQKQMVSTKTPSAHLNREYALASTHLEKLETKYGHSASHLRRLKTKYRENEKAVESLQKEKVKLADSLSQTRQKMNEAGISARHFSKHERMLKNEINQTTAALKRQQDRMGKINAARNRLQSARARAGQLAGTGTRMMAAGVATGLPVAASVNEYAKAEDAATGLKVALMERGGFVPPAFERINQLAMQLGDKLPGATSDFQNMMTMLKRQGISNESILGGMGKATAYLAVQMKKAPEEAAEFAAKMQDATKTTESNMLSLMDVIQRTYYLGVDDNNMLQAFSKLSPAMDIMRMKGLAATKVLAPLLVMADQAGMRGEASGNAYRKIFQLSMDAGKMAKTNQLMGGKGRLDFTDGKGEFGGLEKMFQQLQQLKKLNTQTRQAVIKSIFGDDAETLQAVTIMMEKGIDGYREVEGRMAAQADLQKRVNVQLGTLRNLWDAASGTFVNGLVAFGESIAPEVKALVEWLGQLAEKMGAWARENPKLAGTLMKITAILAGLITAAGAITLAVAGILVPLAMLKLSMATLGIQGGILAGALGVVRTAVLFVGRAVMMNPIGLLVTGLAIAGYLAYKHWDKIKSTFSSAVEWFKGLRERFFGFGQNIITGLIGGIKAATGELWNKVKSIGAGIAETFQASMGIHSPSRVMASLGDFTMQGLAQGLERRADLPLQKVSAMANRLKQIGAGIAIGAAALPAGAFDTRPPLAGAKAPAAYSSHDTIQIIIQPTPGMDEHALARAVARELDKREHQKAARMRSSFHDY